MSLLLVGPGDDHGRTGRVEGAARGRLHILERDGIQERRQASVVVETEAEELFGLQEARDRAVGLERARD